MEIMVQALKTGEKLKRRSDKIYPPEVMAAAVEEFVKRLRANHDAIPGECLPPPGELTFFINLMNASHVVRHCYMEKGWVIAKLDLVGHFDELSKKGLHFGGTLRTYDTDAGGKEVISGVVEKCTIVTVDLSYREEE